MKVNQKLVPLTKDHLEIALQPSAPATKLKRSKSTSKQFENMAKLAQQLGGGYARSSMLKLYEEYLDNSSTHYEPDDLDYKYYKNIKENQ